MKRNPLILAILLLVVSFAVWSATRRDDGMESRSPHWPTVRAEHLKVEPVCRCCGANQTLEVHHVKPFHLHPELECDPSNLVTLCRRCHLFLGHLSEWKSYNTKVREDADAWHERILRRP